ALGCRRHPRRADDADRLTEPFVRKEEEGSIFGNRTAQRAAELVPVQGAFAAAQLVGEKIGGVEPRIPKVLEGRAVKLVTAAFRYDVDLPARAASELRQCHTSLDRELLNGIGNAKIIQRRIIGRIQIADAVNQIDVRLGTRPGHREAAERSGGGRRYSRSQQ